MPASSFCLNRFVSAPHWELLYPQQHLFCCRASSPYTLLPSVHPYLLDQMPLLISYLETFALISVLHLYNILCYNLVQAQIIVVSIYNTEVVKWLEKRSEEHTSELQSRFDLVCRLLL